MFNRGVFAVFYAILAGGFLAVTPGCEWLKGSDPSARSSPFISNLEVNPKVVDCGKKLLWKFDYDDPQGDIDLILVTFKHDDANLPDQTFSWPEEFRGSTSGTLTSENVPTEIVFSCDLPKGLWTGTVQLEDDQGNKSNILPASITVR